MAEEIDELAGVEAFAPREPGDPDDPFAVAFAESRRDRSAAGGATSLAGSALVVAVIVLVVGVLSVVLGIPTEGEEDDVDSDDVASSLDQTTTSSIVGSTSTTSASTSTTASLSPGTGTATSTTAPRTTLTTVRTTTTLPEATTTTALVNRDLQIDLDLSDDEPAVGEPVTMTITMTDPDAVPTGNCQVIEIDGEVLFPDDPCDDACDEDGSGAEPTGGTRELNVVHTFGDVGTFTVEVTGHSGVPECNNPYASETTETFPVTVGPAS